MSTLKYYKIDPTGNITLIVETPVPRESQSTAAAFLMAADKQAEQVGFLESAESSSADFRLQMMGGEFCGNASLCAAALKMYKSEPAVNERRSFDFEVSGLDSLVKVSCQCTDEALFSGTIDMPLPVSCFDCDLILDNKVYCYPAVRFEGICHVIIKEPLTVPIAEKAVKEWCRQLETPALGLIFWNEESSIMRALVYVRSTDTSVWEGSCASGTCAVAAYSALSSRRGGKLTLTQPGGTIVADIDYQRGALLGITLTGNIKICGEAEAEFPADFPS